MSEQTYTALPPGKYGTSDTPGLRVVKEINPRTLDDGTVRYGFLVASTDDKDNTKGTAFLNIDLRPSWLTDEALCIASNSGEPHEDAPDATPETIAATLKEIEQEVLRSLENNNIPEDQTEEAFETAINNIKTRIRINAAQKVRRLKRWAGVNGVVTTDFGWLSPTSNDFTGESVPGTRFSGTIKEGQNGTTSEVASVFGATLATTGD